MWDSRSAQLHPESFDTLSNTPGSTTNTTRSPAAGTRETGSSASNNDAYRVGTGSDNLTGDNLYSFGAPTSTERAFGGLPSRHPDADDRGCVHQTPVRRDHPLSTCRLTPASSGAWGIGQCRFATLRS